MCVVSAWEGRGGRLPTPLLLPALATRALAAASENINLWQGTCEYCCTPIIRSKQLYFTILIRTYMLRLHVHSKHSLDYKHLMYYEVPLCSML